MLITVSRGSCDPIQSLIQTPYSLTSYRRLNILFFTLITHNRGNLLTNCRARERNNVSPFYHSFGFISSGFKLKFPTLSSFKYLILFFHCICPAICLRAALCRLSRESARLREKPRDVVPRARRGSIKNISHFLMSYLSLCKIC